MRIVNGKFNPLVFKIMIYAIIPVEDGYFVTAEMQTARNKKMAEKVAIDMYRTNDEPRKNYPDYCIAVLSDYYTYPRRNGKFGIEPQSDYVTYHNDADGVLCKWDVRLGYTGAVLYESLVGGVK